MAGSCFIIERDMVPLRLDGFADRTILGPAWAEGCVLVVERLFLALVIGRASKLELKPDKTLSIFLFQVFFFLTY